MKKLAGGLFALLVFLGLPFFFLMEDRRQETEAERRLALEAVLEEGNRLANAAEAAAVPEIQLQKGLERFHRALLTHRTVTGSIPTAEVFQNLHRQELGEDFPRHDIFLTVTPSASEPYLQFGCEQGLGLAGVSGADLIDFVHPLGIPDKPARASTAAALARVVRFPMPSTQIDMESHGQIRWGTAVEGSRAFWWEAWPHLAFEGEEPWQGLLYAAIDLSDLPDGFAVRQLCRRWEDPRSHLLFRAEDGRIISSPGLPPDLQDLGNPPGGGGARSSRGPRFPERLFGGFERFLADCHGTLFLALPFAAGEAGRDFPWLPLALGGLLCVGGYLVVDRSVFGRGPRLTVGWVLIGAFVLVVLLPMSILRGTFRQAAIELTARRIQEAAGDLERDLREPRTLTRRGTMALRAILLKLFAAPRMARRLDLAFETGGCRSLFEGILDDIRVGMSFPGHYRFGGVFFLIGPEGFSKGFASTEDGEGSGIQELVKPFIILGRAIRDRCSKDPRAVSGAIDKSGLEFEMARDTFSTLVGPEWFLRGIRNEGVLSHLQGTIGNLVCLHVPVHTAKGRLMILGCILDQSSLNDQGRWTAFETPDNPRPGRALFSLNDNHHLLESEPVGIASCPGLVEMVRRIRQDNLGRREIVREGKAWFIRQAFPATWMPHTTLAGELVLFNPGGALQTWFRLLFALGVLSALGLSAWSLLGFLGPLGRILGAMRRLPDEPDIALPDDARRTDEFGTLARAFHQMKQALREREILGKYVSASVQRAVKDRDVRAAARKGELRGVTVLFSAVHGPFDTGGATPEERIFAALTRHLEAVSGVAEKTGGEIDKVMGEKILVVFDHERLGGADAAGRSALAVVQAVRADLGDLRVTVGINAGEAVAGILGAPSVRMDYTVIGDTVNLAARLAALADAERSRGNTSEGPKTTVVVSGQFLESLASPPLAEKLATTQVKGKRQAVETWRLG